MNNAEYKKLAKKKSPSSKTYFTIPMAFVSGGIICVIGEMVRQLFINGGFTTLQAATGTSIVMIFLGAFLTGIGVYDKIAKYTGAGTAVPITGFANSIVSPAIEFKSEGLIMGVGAKMFVIAGPVLVYGTISSIVIGLAYFVMSRLH